MKKIPTEAFAINGRFLTQPMTGVQRYAMNVTTAISHIMAEKGASVTLLAPPKALDPALSGVQLRRVGNFGGQAWEQIKLPCEHRSMLLNFCNTAPVLKKNQIVCIHDANVFIAPESYSLRFRLFYKSIQPVVAQRVSKITTVSRFSAKKISENLSVNLSDIAILPNGHEHVFAWDSKQASRAPAILKQERDGYERPFILALGSRARHKNLILLLNLADELAEIGLDLVIAGGESGIFSSEMLKHSANVKHLGFVTDHDLAYLLERALCLAFPSLTEGFGLPALEAMALGCPVISTDCASLPEICGDAALLASPHEPGQWLNHIKALLKSPVLREELIGKGHCQAALFSWTDTAQGYLDLVSSSGCPTIKSSQDPTGSQKVAVIIATLGRPEILSETLLRIVKNQTYKPDIIIISCTDPYDVGEAATWPGVRVVFGNKGLAAQRNAALKALTDIVDIIVFFDDDFIPEANWLGLAVEYFASNVEIVGFTGHVMVDGIKGPGLTFSEVDQLLDGVVPIQPMPLNRDFSPYGCNMAFRYSAIKNLYFDERLVLYGWLEDRDFGSRLRARGGQLVKCYEARGIHMGVKGGRITGERLGYSQVVNPFYLMHKGTMTRNQAFDHILRNFVSNLIKSAFPEPFIDRRGRLRGNLMGAIDLLRGRVNPERVLLIKR